MILYRTEPYPIQMRNIMLLDDIESGGVIYVNKDTYDQALLLSGRMDGDPQRVLTTIKLPKMEVYRTIPGLKGLMENMMKTMPKPINMLAPFLIFCYQNQGIEWKADDREMAYGILHQFSQLVDFNNITLVPAEVRSNLSLPTALIKQYKASWDELCSSLEDKILMEPKIIENTVIMPAGGAIPQNNVPLWSNGAITQEVLMNMQQPAMQPQVQQLVPAPQPQVQQPAPAQQPTVQEQQKTVQPAPAPQPVAKQETKVEQAKPAEQPKAPEPQKSEDEKAADDIAAIIAAMQKESAERDKKRKEKEDKRNISTPKPQNTNVADEPAKPAPIHTAARSTAQQAQELNEVLDEFDF